MAIEYWVEEFLFRGVPPSGPGSERVSAYHVIIGSQAESALVPGQFERRISGALTPEQAQEQFGLSLADLVTGINAVAISNAMALTSYANTLEEKTEALESEVERLKQYEPKARAASELKAEPE